MKSDESMNLEEILDTIMNKEAKPSHEALERWVALYPKHKAELAEFFATWAEQIAIPDETKIDEERINSRLVSHALNLVYQRTAARAPAAAVQEPKRLSEAIAQCGLTEEEFAAKCNLDGPLVAKLDRRLIRPESIPALLDRMASEALQLAGEFVRGLFAAKPIPLRTFKAKRQPELKTEDFIDAVQSSSLSPETKAEWTRTVESESEGKGIK